MEHSNKLIISILREEFADYDNNSWHYDSQYKMIEKALNKSNEIINSDTTLEDIPSIFEIRILKLINFYCQLGLSKSDLVHKMKYVTQNCELS